jgi:hypothetical protein
MPTRSQDTGWDFSQALDLIDLDSQDNGSTKLLQRTGLSISLPETSHVGVKPAIKRLGSFSKLWAQLGVPIDLPPISPEPESEDQAEPDALLSVVELDKAINEAEAKVLEVAHREGLAEYAGLNKKQRSKARKRAEEDRRVEAKLEAQAQKKEREREAEREASKSSLKSIVKKEAKKEAKKSKSAQSNVGAKLRPSTPSPFNQPTSIKDEALALPPASLLSSKLASRPLSLPTQPTGLGPVNNTVSKNPSITATLNTAIVASRPQYSTVNSFIPVAQHDKVGTPVRQQSNQYPFPQTGLVPRTVQPVVVPRIVQPPALAGGSGLITPQSQFQPRIAQVPITPHRMAQTPMTPGMTPNMAQVMTPTITPGMQSRALNIRPRVDRHFHFFHQLLRDFPEDMPSMLAPMQLCNNENSSNEGIHVFVDSSNIMIGFKDALRYNRVQGYEMSFDSLVLFMERRRPVAKRVYAGSHRESAPLPHITKLVETSRAIGYENIVNEQVLVSREDSDKKKFFRSVKKMGWIKAAQLHSGNDGSSSDPEMDAAPATPSPPKWVEQGVDEILHLKMCQSIIDVEVPQTIVLATGDGAEAEHSDGFLAHVERALKKGWKVELVCWKQQTNGGYKNRKFREKWGEQFKIFYLDGYIESLIDTA